MNWKNRQIVVEREIKEGKLKLKDIYDFHIDPVFVN